MISFFSNKLYTHCAIFVFAKRLLKFNFDVAISMFLSIDTLLTNQPVIFKRIPSNLVSLQVF